MSDEDTNICVTYGLNFKIGWQWEQEWYDDPSTPDIKDGFYQLGLEFFTEQGGGVSTLLDIERFYFNNFQAQVDTFKMKLAFGVKYYHTSRRTCLESSFYIDDTLLTIEMQMQMMECSKNLIDCFWSLDNYISKYAKYIDECNKSSPEDIDLYTYEISTLDTTQYLIGDGLDSGDCIPGLLWKGQNPNAWPGQLQDNFWHYVYESLEELNKDE